MMSFQYICGKCGESCKNAGGLATHMKTHKEKSVASLSLLKFLKRTPAKKIPIELKPIKSKPKQVKFKSSVTPSSISSPDVPSNKILSPKMRPIPPPAPLPRRNSEWSPFMAPASLISPDLDRRSPEFRLAHMRFYTELEILFPMLNKKAYYDANKSHLGVGLIWFQQWFDSEASDKELIKAKAKPKPEMVRKQNKVEFQAGRTHLTPEQKLDLIRQYDKQKGTNPGLTQKEFCTTRASQKLATILLALNKPIILSVKSTFF